MLRTDNSSLADGDPNRPVDPELVLVVAVREPSRLRRQLVEPARGNPVVHVAGSDGQEPRRSDRDVDLRDGYAQFADVERVDLEIDRLALQGCSAPARPRARPASHVHRRRQAGHSRWIWWICFLGKTRRGRRNHAGHQRASHQGPRTLCEMPHHPLLGRRDRRGRHFPANTC